MTTPNVICLVIDRLHAAYLGCYGNSWIATPEFDQLAVESFTFDQALVPSPNLGDLCRAYWQKQHSQSPDAMDSTAASGRRNNKCPLVADAANIRADAGSVAHDSYSGAGPSLPRLLGAQGMLTALLSDAAEVLESPAAADFAQVIPCEFSNPGEVASDIAETQLAAFFATACDTVRAFDALSPHVPSPPHPLTPSPPHPQPPPYLLWLHSRGLGGAWDAPLEMRGQYLDDPNEEIPTFSAVPRRLLPADFDPDERLALRRAYAAQVTVLDACLGPLLDLVRDPARRPTLFVFLSARGFPLGEHRRVGDWDGALHSELVQIPWMIRFPDGLGASARSSALVQPGDLPATLLACCRLDPAALSGFGRNLLPVIREDVPRVRDRLALFGAAGDRALRTPAWYLRIPAAPVDDSVAPLAAELFAKPDDRWEINNVSNRCADVADRMTTALAELDACLRSGADPDSLPPLDDVLLNGFE